MERTEAQIVLRQKYVNTLLHTAVELQKDTTDREVMLELLIEASQRLREHLEAELDELREEND